MTWPAVTAWILIFIGILPRNPIYLLYLCFGLGAFGSLSLYPAEDSGVNLIPQACCAVFLVIKILLSKGRLSRAVDAAIDPARLGFLFAFLGYGLFSAYVMPRLFAHMVEVVGMNTDVPWASVLVPTSANVTQPAYVALSAGTVLAFTLAGADASFRRHYMMATLVGGLVLIATGLADLVLTSAGLDSLLEPFRNASYALLTSAEVLGSKRVVGLMPEASAYGPACVVAAGSLVFLRPCFENAVWRDCLVPITAAGLLVMAVLSMSSTAYIGIAILPVVFAVNWVRRVLSSDAPARHELKWEAILACTAALALLGIIALVPHMLDSVNESVDQLIFKKSESSSFEGRMMWTKVGMAAFYATDGLGVGLGSARTSSWFAAILSNTGVIGGLLLGCFIARLYFARCYSADSRTTEFATALKFSLIPWFATAAVSWASVDFGIWVASVFGMITSLTTTDAMLSTGPRATIAHQIRARSRP